MVERVKSTRRGGKKRETLKRLEDKKPRAKPNRTTFTDLGISRLKPPKKGQRLYWDKAQKGLALLVSSGGTKTFRSQYKLHGKWQMRSLGVFGEVVVDETENANVAWAHTNARKDRALAKKGIDPKQQEAKEKETQQDAEVLTYVDVVDQFIEKYAKPRQRTWDQTERTLKGTKAEQKNREGVVAWHNRPFAEITKKEAYDLLDGLVADGRGPKAELTLAWLRTLWRWAWKRDLAPAPIMDAVEIEVEKRVRKKVFDDEAIRATWNAAERLHNDDPVASAFVKLLVLLAPRKAALAGMRRSHLNDPENPTLWTTPPELVKQNKRAEQRDEPRKYLTPLP
ncbi:MAG: Arm DNA-binding domain-containing protein, partial [Hyphomicrobiales bacterium]|nr:Arm DNA-binding domain-containing protein [Hyphomicrobiales bacterium]